MVKQVSRILLYCLVFLTPFIFVQNTNELFEFPKMYFVYFVGSLLIAITVLGRLRDIGCSRCDIFEGRKNGLSFFAGLFVVGCALSTIFSTYLYTSVWGYFSRFNGGLISILILFGIFWSTKWSKPATLQILRTVSFTVLPISVYAIMQHFGMGGKWENDTTIRAFSTFGQPNWYAAYCTMVLPIILYFALEEKSNRVNKIAWFSFFVLGFCGFWYSYSVSGILGLMASLGLFLALNLNSVKRNWSTLVFIMLVCFLFAVLNPGIFRQKISDAFADARDFAGTKVKTTTPEPPQEKPADVESATYAVTDSGFIRKGMWKGALSLAVSSPKIFLLGTGPETFPYEFQKFRPASLNYSSEWNYILNKPHNYYLELLAQNGIIGLVIYLAIVIKVLLIRHRFLTPALFGLFVTNVFGWPTVSTALLFWVFLALLSIDKDVGEGRAPPHLIASLLLISIYIFLSVHFAKQYLANTANKKSQKYFEQANVQKALEYADKSIELNPNEPFYYRSRAKTRILQTTGQNIDTTISLKALSLKDMLKAQELSPQNLVTLRGLVPLYYFLSLRDISSVVNNTAIESNIDRFYLEITRSYYKNLSMNYPTDVGVLALVAKYQKMLGLTVDYENTVEQIRILRPDILNWYLE